jgi:hypothetical protein
MARALAIGAMSLLCVAALPGGARAEDEPDREVEAWLARMGSSEETTPFEALNALIGFGARAAPGARALVADEGEPVVRRWQAAKVLGFVGVKEDAALLLVHVTGTAPAALAAVAAEAVGRLGDAQHRAVLEARFGAISDPMARRAVANAIVALGGTRPTGADAPHAVPTEQRPAVPADPARGWVKTPTKEGGGGPALTIRHADGRTEALAPSADTMLIAYIPQGVFGAHPNASLDAAGQNRILLRYALPAGARVERAELSLRFEHGAWQLVHPLEIAVRRVTGAWEEGSVRWDGAPEVEAEPALTFTIPKETGLVTVDVTPLVQTPGDATGWLLAAAKPLTPEPAPAPPSAPPRGEEGGVAHRLLALHAWAPSPAAALERARAEQRLVLTVVRPSYEERVAAPAEEILLATALSDPDVLRVVTERFVPYRTWVHGWYWTFGRAAPDPLAPLGASAGTVKPPALLVTDASGAEVARMTGIGALEPARLLRFLSAALAARGLETPSPPAPPHPLLVRLRHGLAVDPAEAEAAEGEGVDAVRYWLGVVEARRGDLEDAGRWWSRLPSDGPHRLKADAWRAWPERMAQYEQIREPVYPGRDDATETVVPAKDQAVLETRAIAALLDLQQPDGSWRSAMRDPTTTPAITALAARALLLHTGPLAGAEAATFGGRGGMEAAWRRAAARLRAYLETTPAGAANSFGQAYVLDFFLDAAGKDPSFRPDAERARDHLLGGQLESGAWSYTRQFGEQWRGGFGGWPVTDKGRAHSINTAPAILALVRAKGAGLPVDPDALERARDVLLRMKDAGAVFTYVHPEPRSFNELELSVGRASACEHALVSLGAAEPADLRKAIDAFLAGRVDLRKVTKVGHGWTPPRAVSSYFFFYAYHHAAGAIATLPTEEARPLLQHLRDDLLGCVEVDATWIDWEEMGKAYGTAQALLVLETARRAGVR